MANDIIKLDCGCEVEISMVRISPNDPKQYRGGKIIKFCRANHMASCNYNELLEKAFEKHDIQKLELTDKGKFVMRDCPFYECKNRKQCMGAGYLCPAIVAIKQEHKLL